MEIELVNKDLVDIKTIDTFSSLIWTDRLCGFGDFELVFPISDKNISYLAMEYYLTSMNSEHAMIIEDFKIHSDTDTGVQVIVKGRSLESILYRRIIWTKITVTGNLQVAVHNLLNKCAINPDDTDRLMSRLEFEESTDPIFTTLEVNTQFTEQTYLYDAITNLCKSAGVGYKITLTDAGKFRFKLYTGTDRSYSQEINPYVVYSPEYDNLISSDYTHDITPLKNVTFVAGEKGVGNEFMSTVVSLPGGPWRDLDRREVFTDAGDIGKNVYGDNPLTDPAYLLLLEQRGRETLAKNSVIESFEGQADTTRTYVYGEDFSMGDIIQVVDEFGNAARSQVTELINSHDLNGIKTYPTFSAIQ